MYASDSYQTCLQLQAVFDKEQRKTSAGHSPRSLFAFSEETRLECAESKRVRYSTTPAAHWALPVPVDCATNKAEVAAYKAKLAAATAPTAATGAKTDTDGEPQQKKKRPDVDAVHPTVPFAKCLEVRTVAHCLLDGVGVVYVVSLHYNAYQAGFIHFCRMTAACMCTYCLR